MCALCFLYYSHPFTLTHLGKYLILNHHVRKADCIVVISGGYGNRIGAAVRLFQEGKAEWLVVTGPRVIGDHFFSGYTDCNPSWAGLMKAYALDHGIPEHRIVSICSDAESTRDEADLIAEFINNNDWKSAILVTSNYHTRRANRIFSKYASKYYISIYMHAAPDPIYFPEEWWTCRQCIKTIFYEYTKLIFYTVAY